MVRWQVGFAATWLLVYCNDFTFTHLYVLPTSTQTVTEITIALTPAFQLNASDLVTVLLPKFTNGAGGRTSGADVARGQLVISPSTYFEGEWLESQFNNLSHPYPNSTLLLYVKAGVEIAAATSIDVKVYATNGIMVYCGFDSASSSETLTEFKLQTNASGSSGEWMLLEDSDIAGDGCVAMSNCLNRGRCNFCSERCECFERFGDGDDLTTDRSILCASTSCPTSKAWYGLASDGKDAHEHVLECSGAGFCDVESGLCECFPGFTGDSCSRKSCGDTNLLGIGCSGHGQCLTMEQMGRENAALPLTRTDRDYGLVGRHDRRDFAAWDYETMQGCVCDSSWPVGLGDGETQEPEYFGPDCSLRHCPTGVDPSTSKDETDCSNVTAQGSADAGEAGNLCHVECSNRGLCDYNTGKCGCFSGYTSFNCATLIKNAGAVGLR